MKTIVFFGPSIGKTKVDELIRATHAAPIKRGDLEQVGDHDVIVILDGEFGQNLSVSPKEILALLERGKTIIGASSMGALRASELDRDGMIGIGWVYNRFRRVSIRCDDDVALTYSPLDFAPVTVPMVDIEYWVETLQEAGLLSAEHGARVLKAARKIFFANRTEETLLNALGGVLGAEEVNFLIQTSGGTIPSIKALDAEEALRFTAGLGRA
jgi:TfuA protein